MAADLHKARFRIMSMRAIFNRKQSRLDHPDSALTDLGLGLMEAIVGILAGLILISVLIHVARLGYTMYKLRLATTSVADELSKAREMAKRENRKVCLIFDAEENKFGIDRNGNGRLDLSEAEELPDGVTISETISITFTPSGTLPPKSKEPQITISNERGSNKISVSSMGSISID
jgi:hypothetical protein